MITALDHIAIAVPDLEKAIARFAKDFDLTFEGREDVANARTSTAFFPVPATSIIVTHDKADLLLVKRSVAPQKGFWCLPGGFIELDESPEQAALRELEEETGLSGQIDRLLGVTTNHSDRYNSVLMVGYLVKDCSGDLNPGDYASDAAYFDAGKLPEALTNTVQISAKFGTGIEKLLKKIRQICGVVDFDLQAEVCFTSRQENLLKQLKKAKSKEQAASIITELLNGRLGV